MFEKINKSFLHFFNIYGEESKFNNGKKGVVFVFYFLISILFTPILYFISILLISKLLKNTNNPFNEFIFSKNQLNISNNLNLQNTNKFIFIGDEKNISDLDLFLLSFLTPFDNLYTLYKSFLSKRLRNNDFRVIKLIGIHNFISKIFLFTKGYISYNDHSHYNYLIFLISKDLCVKSIYIQHAPVTKKFPKLYHSMNFIFSEDSLSKYSINDRNSIINKYKLISDIRFWNLKNKNLSKKKLDFLICPNKLDDLDDVFKLYDYLEKNNFSAIIRLHPADKRIIPFSYRESKNNNLYDDINCVKNVITNESSIPLQSIFLKIKTIKYKFIQIEGIKSNDVYGFLYSGLIKKEFNKKNTDLILSLQKDVSYFQDNKKLKFYIGDVSKKNIHKKTIENEILNI